MAGSTSTIAGKSVPPCSFPNRQRLSPPSRPAPSTPDNARRNLRWDRRLAGRGKNTDETPVPPDNRSERVYQFAAESRVSSVPIRRRLRKRPPAITDKIATPGLQRDCSFAQ